MPYLPLDLDAKRKATMLARGLGIDPATVVFGLLELWEHVWREKDDRVSGLYLNACFGSASQNRDLRGALMEAGFIEVDSHADRFRVRGAGKWLLGMEGKSRGGHAAKKNLIPGAIHKALAKAAEEQKPIPSAPAEDQPKPSPSPPSADSSALTPNTQHPAPKEALKTDTSETPAAGAAVVVFEHWASVMGKTESAKFKGKRRRAVEARLKEGFTPEQLCRAVDGCRKSPFHMGQNDRRQPFNDLELICRDAAKVEAFIDRAAQASGPPPVFRDPNRPIGIVENMF